MFPTVVIMFLTADWLIAPIALPIIRYKIFYKHRTIGRIVAPVMHFAASVKFINSKNKYLSNYFQIVVINFMRNMINYMEFFDDFYAY